MIASARLILEHVPSLKGKPLVVTELGGGMTNKIYKVEDGQDAYVLRVFGAGTTLLGIDREREVACSRAVATAGIGADVVAYLPELNPRPFEAFCGALLVGFLPGRLLKEEHVQDPEIMRRIGQSLRLCHAAPIDDKIAPFSVFAVIANYLEQARQRNVALPPELGDAQAALQRIEGELGADEPLYLCHNDLLAGNFVDDGTTLRIIDWEYGGRGNRFFDLGNFAANLQLTGAQESALLQAYFGDVRPEQLRRLKLMRLASDLRESSWGYLQSAVSTVKPAQYYLDYGAKHLARYLEGVRLAGLAG